MYIDIDSQKKATIYDLAIEELTIIRNAILAIAENQSNTNTSQHHFLRKLTMQIDNTLKQQYPMKPP